MSIDTSQFVVNNSKIPIELVDPKKDLKTTKELFEQSTDVNAEDIESSSKGEFQPFEFSSVDLRSLELFVADLYDLYVVDYSLPPEINIDGLSLRFGDLKIDYLKKTRLVLALTASGLTIAMIASLLMLPKPYNLASLALCGPLFVSTYGLITQK
jgi:hypothetical protein